VFTTSPSFFCWDGVSQMPELVWNPIFQISALHSLGWQAHATEPSYWLTWGSCELFAWASLKPGIPLISAFKVAKITGISHW
jgi:hypothetical protein